MDDELRSGGSPENGPQEQAVPGVEDKQADGASSGERAGAAGLWAGGERRADLTCPVVGIGASAGGLAAIEQFFAGVPHYAAELLAFVVVQHLAPNRESMLTELISRYTSMPVQEVVGPTRVKPGNVYVIPPNADIGLANGMLNPIEPENPGRPRLPIDYLFRSMARECNERGVVVILSGTGSDGTLGLKAVKEANGLVVVQQPETAQYDGMPRSAIETGLADYVLPPQEMADRIADYVQRMSGRPSLPHVRETETATSTEPLRKLFSLLRAQTGHDFSRYKRNTIVRRIDRRMVVNRFENLEAYVAYLQQTPEEVVILFRELLIGVTNFFRDPEVFALLEKTVIPALFAEKQMGETVRVWVPGCSTGEEAYSIAILLQEHILHTRSAVTVQIFATDIDVEALDLARTSIYPSSIAADVSEERLSRFFVADGGSFRLKKVVRDMVVFAAQNVAEDPPFSRMDLVSCRNVLIYMNGDLQRKVLPLFHYALNPNGYLLLGTSESTGEFTDLFATTDRKHKLYTRKAGGLPRRALVDFSRPSMLADMPARRPVRDIREERMDMRQVIEQVLLAQHAPPAVVVNAEGEVIYIHGRTGYYLEPAPGDASLNILRMAREGIRLDLNAALRKAKQTQEKVIHRDLRVAVNGEVQITNLVVRPLTEAPREGLYLVVFQPVRTEEHAPAGAEGAPQQGQPVGDKDQRIHALERELRTKEESLQATVEEPQTSNEELTSSNEELQSANEELQSTNEELETSKEELQSVNEELMTVNVELQKKIEELSRLNNDLNNLLAGTGIGTVFVDHTLRIQRFTPAATDIINLIQTDIGRPAAHIVSNLANYPDLMRDIGAVLDTLIPKEREVQAINGKWYLMRLQPYRTLDNVIEGAVLTFVDITAQKQMQAALDEARRMRVESLFDPAIVVHSNGRVTDANGDALALFGYTAEELQSLRLSELVQDGSYERLRAALEAAARGDSPQLDLELCLKDKGAVAAKVRLRRTEGDGDGRIFMVVHPVRA